MLRHIADSTSRPDFVQTGHANRERSQDVRAPVPSMEDRDTIPYLGHELEWPSDEHHHGQQQMHCAMAVFPSVSPRA